MVNLFERIIEPIFHRVELRQGKWLLNRMKEERDDMRVALICERNTAAFLRGLLETQTTALLKSRHQRADREAVREEMVSLLGKE